METSSFRVYDSLSAYVIDIQCQKINADQYFIKEVHVFSESSKCLIIVISKSQRAYSNQFMSGIKTSCNDLRDFL